MDPPSVYHEYPPNFKREASRSAGKHRIKLRLQRNPEHFVSRFGVGGGWGGDPVVFLLGNVFQPVDVVLRPEI